MSAPAQPASMEVDPQAGTSQSASQVIVVQAPVQARPFKRKVVDEYAHEVPDSKRNRAVPDDQLKLNVIKLILHWHEYLRVCFHINRKDNLDDIADITAIVQTIHTKFRQDMNGVGALKDKINDDFQFTAAGRSVPYRAIKAHMKHLANEYGFHYQNSDADRKAIGTLSSILGLIVGFRHRFTEVRLGTTALIHRKDQGVDEVMEIGRFGLTNSHCTTLQGCRFTPSFQSAMRRLLGPMTIALNLCMNSDPRYQKSWKAAFVQAFKLLPNVDEIAYLLAGSKTKCKAILRHLADISLFGVTRTSNRGFIPAAMLMTFVSNHHAGYKERYDLCNDQTAKIDDDMIPVNIRNLDFSSHGLLHFWNGSSATRFFIRGNPAKLSTPIASQLVFHAVFGSHKENLHLLEWMTGEHFVTRRAVGDAFKERSASGGTVPIKIIAFKHFFKMASASTTQLPRGEMGAVARGPTFSGRFIEEMDADRDFFKVVQATQSTKGFSGPINEPKLITVLQELKENMTQDLAKRKMFEYGTTEFYDPVPNGDGSAYGQVATGPGTLPPRYFYQEE